jgi:hypothetical protein
MAFLQTGLLNRFHAREAKLQILDNYWHQFIFKLHAVNIKVKDGFTSGLIDKIMKIHPTIKRRCLEEFLRCSQRVHTIAFLQWRIMYPSKIK